MAVPKPKSSDAAEFFDRGEQQERVTWTAVATIFDTIYLPENREQLEEIVRQGQEASRIFNQARQMQRPVEEMVTEWGMPGN